MHNSGVTLTHLCIAQCEQSLHGIMLHLRSLLFVSLPRCTFSFAFCVCFSFVYSCLRVVLVEVEGHVIQVGCACLFFPQFFGYDCCVQYFFLPPRVIY